MLILADGIEFMIWFLVIEMGGLFVLFVIVIMDPTSLLNMLVSLKEMLNEKN